MNVLNIFAMESKSMRTRVYQLMYRFEPGGFKENRKVYRIEEGKRREVETVVNGKLKLTEVIKPPRCSSRKEVIEISDTDADRIAANDDVPFARWYIVDGELTETKPEIHTD